MMSLIRKILSEKRWTLKTFSIHFSASKNPAFPWPLSLQHTKNLYNEFFPLISIVWFDEVQPAHLCSWILQRSTTSKSLLLRVPTFHLATLNFVGCSLDLPLWPYPASRTLESAKPETLPAGIKRLLVAHITDSVEKLAIIVVTKCFIGPPGLAVVPTQLFPASERSAIPTLGMGALPLSRYLWIIRLANLASVPVHQSVKGCHSSLAAIQFMTLLFNP